MWRLSMLLLDSRRYRLFSIEPVLFLVDILVSNLPVDIKYIMFFCVGIKDNKTGVQFLCSK